MGESKTMKRIRVLHSELNGELGGIESFLYNVYRFIDKEKVEFDFLTISDTPAYGDKFKKMGSTVYKVPKHINFLGYYFAIDKILREGNYDIVHIHKNSAIDILILKVLQRFPNIKVVVHSHNTFPSVGGKLEKLHKFNRKYLYDNADYRLACSDNAGKWMYGNVQGTNYLAEDCNRLISFFDARSGRPGADNLFEDLFVSVSEQEDDPAQPTLFELLYQQMDKEPQKAESGGSSKSLDQDEKFSLLAPYVKLSADPQEVYLNMRVRGGVATEEEKQKLIQLQNQRTQKEKMLPDHAWLMEPCFPDVINEYIVDYVVNVRDAERFAKLVKSNSVMGFAKFISLALDDWPESDVFQKIAITPPNEELNDSEYYLGLMSRISAIKDIAAVEDVLLEREPIFQRYELELWRRIAIVLTDRGDIRRLYNSGLKYIRFLKEISEKVTIRDEAVDAIEAYCVGLHNAEAVDEYGAFLKKCGELTQLLADNKRIAVICCQNYGRLMHLRLYKNVNAEIQEEWNAIVEILKQCNYDEDVYKNVLDAVEEYFRTLVQRKKEDKLFELERFMAQVYEENGRCEAAEVAAFCLANLYNSGGHRKITPDEYETIKKYLQKFPESMHIRAAFIIASEAIYSPSAEYKRVPDKIINKAKQWSEQYPKKIEFQEAYFGLLFSRLKYAQAQDMRNEQRRVYREMKTVAERANYSEYNESNQLMESVDILHRVFGY